MENEVTDVDALYEQAMNSNESHGLIDDTQSPMTVTEGQPVTEAQPQQAAQPTPAQAQAIAELEFNWNGKQIKAPFTDPRIKQWASQGYDYAQRMAQFNQDRTQWDTTRKDYETKYKPINDWAIQNPDKWQSLHQMWEQQQAQAQQGQPQPVQLPPEVQSEIQAMKQFMEDQQQKEQQIQIQQEDTALNAEVESVRKEYPHIDFNAVDEHGKSLEFRVLEYAQKKGIPTFTDAFLGFHHKELLKQAEERGKSAHANSIQKNAKLGLLNKSSTPTRELTPVRNLRDKSYNDLADEALSELGLIGS
jgi:hypothetical protein